MAHAYDSDFADTHEHTFLGLVLWKKRVFNQYAEMVLAHHDTHPLHRAKIVAYGASMIALHRALDAKLQVTSSPDKLRDLKIMHDKVGRLAAISIEHLELDYPKAAERIERVLEAAIEADRSRLATVPVGRSPSRRSPSPRSTSPRSSYSGSGSGSYVSSTPSSRYSTQAEAPSAPYISRTSASRLSSAQPASARSLAAEFAAQL